MSSLHKEYWCPTCCQLPCEGGIECWEADTEEGFPKVEDGFKEGAPEVLHQTGGCFRSFYQRPETKQSPPNTGASASQQSLSDSAQKISDKCDEIKAFLIEKNRQYGNSALEPVRIFSKASKIEQLKVRLDDKLSRIKRGVGMADTEDVKKDIVGYIILWLIDEDEQNE